MDWKRRSVLKGIGGTTGTAALAGCLGGGDSAPGEEGALTGPYTLRMWHSVYGDQEVERFGEENNIETENVNFESPSDPYSDLQAGQFTGDTITFLHEWGQRAWENDFLQPIDTNQLENFDNLDDRFQDMNFVSDDEVWGVPYDVGIFSLTYQEEEFSSAPESWEVLFDPEYEDRILMQDAPSQGCQLAALYTGQDPLDPDDFDEIEEVLENQNDLVHMYWDEFEIGMRQYIQDEVDVGQLTVGRTIQAALDHDTAVDYTVPEEGAMTYYDEFTIPENAEHTETAYAWIDFYLDGGGPIFTELERYRATTANLEEEISDELVPWFEWPEEWDLVTQELLDEEVQERYDEIWTSIRS